ncbi:MAG: cytochrome P460 family protein [Flavobacteriales bacterium]
MKTNNTFALRKTHACIAALFAVLLTIACRHEKDSSLFDSDLFVQASASDLVAFMNGDTLDPAGNSPHSSFTLHFNSTSYDALTEDGELPVGGNFPVGSLVVKSIVNAGSIKYAVMKKDPTHENAAGGWLWAEYGADGSVVYSTGEKGQSCTGCHSQAPHRDYTRTFDLH